MTETVANHAAPAPHGGGLHVPRRFTEAGRHPYDTVTWGRRDIVVTDPETGEPTFEQVDVEFPDAWSTEAATVVATQYFHGEVGEPGRENSLRHVIDRVVRAYMAVGRREGYFASSDDVETFGFELGYLMLHQVFAFDGPVWSTVGTVDAQRVSDAFILSVDDSMDSIHTWYRHENELLTRGSRAGLNVSQIRSSRESHGSGEEASGPVSFMRGADTSFGRPVGSRATRRVVLDVDHPDVAEFVASTARSQAMLGVLRDAGFEPGRDLPVARHRAGSTLRLTDEFMQAVEDGEEFGLRARTTGEVVDWVDAGDLWSDVAQAVWACGEPSLQLDDTINDWHTTPEAGRVAASDPASGYLHVDDSTCALGSIDLLAFGTADGGFDVEGFVAAVELAVTALDIGLSLAPPTMPAIARTSESFRQIGLGYGNLGALLTASGLAYDSDDARSFAGAVTSLMTATASRRSAELAAAVAPYPGLARDAEQHRFVVLKHSDATDELQVARLGDVAIRREAARQWADSLDLGRTHGWRNAHLSALAPARRAAATLGCATRGVEPHASLVRSVELVNGSVVDLVEPSVQVALTRLGYDSADVEDVLEHLSAGGSVADAPALHEDHREVLASGHEVPAGAVVQMAAACQPFVSGAVALTVQAPEQATVADVQDLLHDAWRLGLKTVAVHRENCEATPARKAADAPLPTVTAEPVRTVVVEKPVRRRLPRTRDSSTTAFSVAGTEGYLTSSTHDDGTLGEVFLALGKQGSAMAGLTEALGIAVSVGLQHGVALETFVEKFTDTRFEPAGVTDDPDVRTAQSLLDYLFRRLALDHLPLDARTPLGIHSAVERQRHLETGEYGDPDDYDDLDGLPLSMPVVGPGDAR